MHFPFKKPVLLFVAALAFATISLPSGTRAQTYPIDCAILLCLSGGWPASVPCARARAEFIRRITPWPVEPPLQIWRCPMGASHELERRRDETGRLFDVLVEGRDIRPRQSFAVTGDAVDAALENAVWSSDEVMNDLTPVDLALRSVRERADIDIGGPEFNFVRSIRVFDVRFASQRVAGENDQCRRHALVYLGTYGMQGEFSWAVSAPTALPDAHVGLEGWGSDCPGIYNRSVFVDWRDYEGAYGFEQVNY
ncbi:hypothetical protein SAMN05443999_1199 [Roseovarius azorensis]|uniref:Uncharacterized protein n=1 Tax=Roseovarius azorensis TaxID=1287727 RepID=A0A1H7X7F0_9RHOB|nr:hypothetical protein [Roseovarius azorensis]SEM29736.1 hypothetical protein SAMN05443999_1199 [Roseovarius azorensis]